MKARILSLFVKRLSTRHGGKPVECIFSIDQRRVNPGVRIVTGEKRIPEKEGNAVGFSRSSCSLFADPFTSTHLHGVIVFASRFRNDRCSNRSKPKLCESRDCWEAVSRICICIHISRATTFVIARRISRTREPFLRGRVQELNRLVDGGRRR